MLVCIYAAGSMLGYVVTSGSAEERHFVFGSFPAFRWFCDFLTSIPIAKRFS